MSGRSHDDEATRNTVAEGLRRPAGCAGSDVPIARFAGDYRWLSNFWLCEVWACGVAYPSVEHAYQAMKTRDVTIRELIRDEATPAGAQQLGRRIPVRADWDEIKLKTMEQLVCDKFTRNGELGLRLCATAPRALVEGNDWGDRFWGVCDGAGLNHLGRILMCVRAGMLARADGVPSTDQLPGLGRVQTGDGCS